MGNTSETGGQLAMAFQKSKAAIRGISTGDDGQLIASDWKELAVTDQLCNPNLLDNWYFGNPVNQRNIASDTIWGSYQYGLDRWRCFNTPSIAWSSNGYITMKSGQQNCLIDQFLEGTLLSGMVCTLSALTDRKLHTVTGTVPFNTSTGEFSNISVTTNDGKTTVRFWKSAESRYPDEHVIAVKLELGDEQTLAHQDSSGNWILNEIPDFGEQLRRCQRYFYSSMYNSIGESNSLKKEVWATGSSYGSTIHYCEGTRFPVVMRTIPIITIYSGSSREANKISHGTDDTISSVTIDIPFVGPDGFTQLNLSGLDDALNNTQVSFHYTASADL